MGYDLRPKNEDLETFHFGAFGFPVLLEQFGYLFSCVQVGARWCYAPGVDPRMGDTYPKLLTNDGFPVTDEEARIMGRMARNFVAIQRSLPDNQPEHEKPMKIRTDWVNNFEKFAEWAERSGGFEIW